MFNFLSLLYIEHQNVENRKSNNFKWCCAKNSANAILRKKIIKFLEHYLNVNSIRNYNKLNFTILKKELTEKILILIFLNH